jgi:hypothetical protein
MVVSVKMLMAVSDVDPMRMCTVLPTSLGNLLPPSSSREGRIRTGDVSRHIGTGKSGGGGGGGCCG